MVLSGCAIVVGRHPDIFYGERYCYPCVETTKKFGVGIMWSSWEDRWYRKINVVWDYDDFWKRFFSWQMNNESIQKAMEKK